MPSGNTVNPALLKPDTAWKIDCQIASGSEYIRENFVKKIFANPDKDANVKIAGIIDEILNRDSRLGRT